MIYTLRGGVDDRHERVENYLLRFLPVIVASAIAIFGAFSNANQDNRSESNNQEPLAIYTAPPTDLGKPTNPQGDGTDVQNNGNRPPSDASGQTASNTQDEARAPTTTPPSGNGGQLQASQPTTGIIGGRGGGDTSGGDTSGGTGGGTGGGGSGGGDCLCQEIQEATDPSNLTGTVDDTTKMLGL